MIASSANAYFSIVGSGNAAAATSSLAPPTIGSAPSTSGSAVTISWAASSGSIAPQGYFVTRESSQGIESACATSAAASIQATTCTDQGVAEGTYTYSVVAKYHSWTATSAPSSPVIVTATETLGAAARYSVLSGAAITNSGATRISGSVGISPATSVTGLPRECVGGSMDLGNAAAAAGLLAFDAAFDLNSQLEADSEIAGDLIGRTFAPGVYHSDAALAQTGRLTLDAAGDPDATFVFQVDAALNTAAGSSLVLINGARASNVIWQVDGAAGLGANSTFAGTILASGAITLGNSSTLLGRALAKGAVTLASNTIRFSLELPPSIVIVGGGAIVTKNVTPTITGTTDANPGRTVTVTLNGAQLATAVQANGSWAVESAPLAAGTYTAIATVRDGFGNNSSASQRITVERNPATVALGSTASYSVLGAGVASTGETRLSGDLGVFANGSLSGFPPGIVGGTLHNGDTFVAGAQADLDSALAEAANRTPDAEFAGDLNGRTFHAGVYHTAAASALTGTLTLDGEGDPNSVFIFQIDGALDSAAGSAVELTGGAQASNVFWVVQGAAGTGATSVFAGTILARGAVTLGAGSALNGRALSRAVVTLSANAIAG